ncbi:hypothetical protein F4859DRAFT_522502 [Xylaria cf. heliscus]|nr:hypothetical protein F4859DRAFT_522502 [Xylaria cf. heliscus]
MANLPAPPTTFPQFTRLPPEIRVMIWALCFPSRGVNVTWDGYHSHSHSPRYHDIDEHTARMILALPVQPPVISRVCRESRVEALKFAKYNGERPFKLPRRPTIHGGQKPRKRAHGHLWFNRRVDMIIFEAARPMYTGVSTLPGNISNHDRVIAPELEGLLSDPKIPICINRNFIRTRHLSVSSTCERWRVRFAEWALEYIVRRKHCIIVVWKTRLFTTYQTACESGLFGLFAEEKIAYIDIRDKRKIAAVRKLGKLGSLDNDVQMHSKDTRKEITTFLEDARRLWLQKKKRNQNSTDLPTKFTPVISVELSLPHMPEGPKPGLVDMGLFPTAD